MPSILGANSVSGYEISNSLRFNDDDQAHLSRTVGTPTNEKIYTVSVWIKKGQNDVLNTFIGTPPEGDRIILGDTPFFFTNGSADSYLSTYKNTRDVAAWYHVVIAYNTTESTAANRVKLYLNGTFQAWDNTTGTLGAYPSLNNTNGKINKSGETLYIGRGHSGYGEGYFADFNLIDGQALDPTYFGETDDNGVWIPKAYTGTYGNNGFFLEFQQTGTSQNSSGIGADTSGNDHHFAPTQLGSIDITSDTCTNNWCTMSNLYSDKQQGGAITFSQGLTEITTSYVDADYQRYPQAMSSIAVTKGKWYFEMKPISGDVYNIGVFSPEDFASDSTTNPYGGYAATGVIYTEVGQVRQNDSTDSGHASYGTSDIVGCALDMDNNAVYFHKNNTYINSGNATSGASKTGAFTLPTTGENGTPITLYGFTCGDEGAADVGVMKINFGNPPYTPDSIESDANGYGSFEFAPPSGYYALCTKNLAEYG